MARLKVIAGGVGDGCASYMVSCAAADNGMAFHFRFFNANAGSGFGGGPAPLPPPRRPLSGPQAEGPLRLGAPSGWGLKAEGGGGRRQSGGGARYPPR